MSLILVEQKEQVAILKLNNSVTNPINPELVRELSGIIENLRDDPGVRALLVTSSTTKFFSIGLAIPELYHMTRKVFSEFLHSFNQLCIDLFSFPKPTVAVLNGHAIAGGCVLALCSDYRYIASERKLMGLNEIKLGVPVPSPADTILRSLVGTRNARDIMESGDFFSPEKSLELGLVDDLFSLEELQEKAFERAKILSAMPGAAYRHIKRNRIQPLMDHVRKYREEKEQYFMDCWFSEDTRGRLKEAMEKF